MDIIGRHTEQALLARLAQSRKPEFLAVYGRRRVGKTFLVREFYAGQTVFALTGKANARTTDQLQVFREALADASGTDPGPVPTWSAAFRLLKAHLAEVIAQPSRPGKLVVFIDELPWLATAKSGFISAFEHFWNSWASARPELLLVVCGSATSWIIDHIIRDHGGLHNRVTARLPLQPLTLGETQPYLAANSVVLNRLQIAELYMVLGGIPYYLDQIQPGLSPAQAIDAAVFAAEAPLADEFENLYASLFRHPETHIRLVEALGARGAGLTQTELVRKSGIPSGGTMTKALAELEQCGFIRSYRDFGRASQGRTWQLTDYFTQFHLKHIKPRHSVDPKYWENAPGRAAWNGFAFERLALDHIEQIKQRLGIAGVSTDVSAWRSRHSTPGVQIDLVIDRRDGIINLCELKFSAKPFSIDTRYDAELRLKRETFAEETKTAKALHTTLVTAAGLAPGTRRGEVQSEVTLDDLFQP
ncbi:MAG: AAA family ATPase [Propionibacteriaceae bacterium]|nr:AAA family ATPase [Propionibacteriaceae bacterium]